MFDTQKLNEEIFAIGIDNIAWIAQAHTEDPQGDWECYTAPDNADPFGFDVKKGFKPDINQYYDHYVIQDSVFKGMKDVVLIGYGLAYAK